MANDKEIIISIQLKGAKASAQLDKTSKSTSKLARATKTLNDLQKQEAIDVAKVNQQIKIQKEVNEAAARSALKMATSSQQAAVAANAMKTNAGLNNAIIAESARLASDASFGFTAIANNLGQLVSLFSASANAAGGLRSAFAALFTAQSIFLISIQLLITFGNDIINFFKGSQKAADDFKKALEDLEETVESQRMELLGYIEVLKDTNISEKTRLNALKELEAVSPNIVDTYNDQKTSLKELTDQVEEYIRQQRLRGELEALLEANQELFVKREKIRAAVRAMEATDDLKERRRILDENTNIFQELEALRLGTVGKKGLIARFLSGEDDVDVLKGFQELTKGTEEQFQQTVKRIIEIEKQLTADRDDPTGSGAGSRVVMFSEFRKGLLNLDRDIEKINQDSLNRFLRTEQAKLVQEEANQKNIFRVRFNTFVETEKLRQKEFVKAQETRLKNFKAREDDQEKQLLATKAFNEAVLESKKDLDESIIAAEKELNEALEAITKNFNDRTAILNEQVAQRILQIAFATEIAQAKVKDALSGLPSIFQSTFEEVNIRQLESQVKLQTKLVDVYKEGTEERMNAELLLAQLQEQLANAQIDRERRRFNEIKEIYTQGVGVIKGISDTRKNIEINNAKAEFEARVAQGENEIEAKKKYDEKVEEANRKAWKVEQGLKISRVIMDTYQAGILAYGSQLIIGDPTSPIRAQVAQALTLANGAAQIAAILATKYDSKNLSGVSGPSAGRSDVNVEAPDFNVVGASPQSLLASSISQQVTQPIKAFVVGKEITNQQELDRNITTTAGL